MVANKGNLFFSGKNNNYLQAILFDNKSEYIYFV